jgi:hypothetical protein
LATIVNENIGFAALQARGSQAGAGRRVADSYAHGFGNACVTVEN